ncbi:MAG: 16S rRNA (uracil(1498)-N(3))-methyltransferase, partial [Burkholderiaceae bacterium]|jgi:16S rRNA (uracil1498-N3)-methyltransferase|nr:16S rRNA (uracil(1498)-N(3))-methyltransferase [Burkholderiaceae bacterium]
MPRLYLPAPIGPDRPIDLPPGAARHAQVLRLQPGDDITLFNGEGGEWTARVVRMGKSAVTVQALAHRAVEREAARAVHLTVGGMAAERLDWLIEKAVELGAASLTPIVTARTQQRLTGELAAKKRAHWQAVAAAACEQCGRNRLMAIGAPLPLAAALSAPTVVDAPSRWLLSLAADAAPLRAAFAALPPGAPVTLLSGPEGGFTDEELASAQAAGWRPVTLGARVLRAETAPLTALAVLTAL